LLPSIALAQGDGTAVVEDAMLRPFQVTVGPGGHPVVDVPASCLWDLVDYLSIQRVSVTYHFEQTHFTVVFPKSEPACVERLLQDWAASAEQSLGV
jgi:hypothetical protein